MTQKLNFPTTFVGLDQISIEVIKEFKKRAWCKR